MDYGNAKILVVDDEMINIKVLIAILDEYECIVAKDGEKALMLAEGDMPPDLILLDVMMPGMDGYEVCRRLKSQISTQNIPVIFITSKGNVDEETRGLRLGAADYITKPFSPEIVKARATNQIQFKKQRDLLERLNVTDQLTGIANRRCFDDTLDYECRSAARSGSPLSLVLIDIDNFKQLNDLGGHVFGDNCLKAVAEAICKSMSRSTDLIARYGGDEFVAVLPSTDHEGAIKVAEKIRQSVEALKLTHSGETVPITISLGLTSNKDYSPENMIEAADSKLYEAKHNGRNKACS